MAKPSPSFHTAYTSCRICPRNCGTDRNAGNRGVCGETADLRIAWAGLHFGEEPPVTGRGGSGIIFITGCNLGCVFCQNWQISQDGMGASVSPEMFAELCLRLAATGAENINIVTGSHAVPVIARGLSLARTLGLNIPVLWNTSSYETPETLSMLDGLVDVWLPDLKTLNPAIAQAAFHAADYPKAAKKAIRFMVERSPLRIDNSGGDLYPAGLIKAGVILRHLVLPGRLDDTAQVLRWFAEHLKDKAVLSLMTQYTPVKQSPHSAALGAFPDRPILHSEFQALHALLEELDIDAGFYQELVEGTEWLPDFNKTQPFSSELAKPLWHWQTGFIDSN